MHCGHFSVILRIFGDLILIQSVQGQIKVGNLHLLQCHYLAGCGSLHKLCIVRNGEINGNRIVTVFYLLHSNRTLGRYLTGLGGDHRRTLCLCGHHTGGIHGGNLLVGGSPCNRLIGGIFRSNRRRQIQKSSGLKSCRGLI